MLRAHGYLGAQTRAAPGATEVAAGFLGFESVVPAVSHRRQSMAFFSNLNMDAEVKAIPTCVTTNTPAKYAATTAGEHLMAKHLASTMGILDDSWMKDAASILP